MIPLYPMNQGTDLNRCRGVDGVNGVRLFQTTPNSRIPVFDEDEDYLYVVSTDSMNNKSQILRFKLEFDPIPSSNNLSSPAVDTITKSDLDKFREEIIADVRNVIQSTSFTNDATTRNGGKNQADKVYDANGKEQRKS